MRPTPIERAFAIARAGQKLSMTQIANALGREGYSLEERSQLYGPTLARQLKEIAAEARRGSVRGCGLLEVQTGKTAEATFASLGELPMTDDKTQTGGQDRKRISLSDDYEVRDWSEKFGVTPERLREAVGKVGSIASDVEQELTVNIANYR